MTIVLGSSAAIAVLMGEPERQAFRVTLQAAEIVMSAGNVVEVMRVLAIRRGPRDPSRLWRFLELFEVQIVVVDRPQIVLAEEAQRRFGKGRAEPPAVLNFGDLFAYALARHLDAPLLFKGEDFIHTDVKPALPA